MSTQVLATKLYIPPTRPQLVPRPRLLARLNEGLHATPGLTLISAPAGFGKTTLLSEWINQKDEGGRRKDEKDESRFHPSRVSWLSLDEGDNDPARFLMYLISALQTVEPELGAGVSVRLQSPQPPPPQVIRRSRSPCFNCTPSPTGEISRSSGVPGLSRIFPGSIAPAWRTSPSTCSPWNRRSSGPGWLRGKAPAICKPWFGGVRGTGNGHREAGQAALEVFTEWKSIYVDYSGKLQKAQIDNN